MIDPENYTEQEREDYYDHDHTEGCLVAMGCILIAAMVAAFIFLAE